MRLNQLLKYRLNDLHFMNKSLYLLLCAFCWGCSQTSNVEKHQNKRDNIINVRDKVNEIVINDVLIGGVSRFYLMDKYLLIGDSRSVDKKIHIFDKENFSYLRSVADMGQGPNEITIMGHIGVNESRREFYVSDHGKLKIFSFNLDSVLADPFYTPQVKVEMNERQFPDDYVYINDSLCIGRIIEPIGNNNFKPSVAKWNMATGEIVLMKYEHPDIKKKRMSFAISVEHGLYVECYSYHDLMSICTLDGELKHNIYGPEWDSERGRISHYEASVFCGDRIVAAYSGKETFIKGVNGEIKSNLPTKLLVFDLNGDYIKTLETEYHISDFCYDEENHRLIMGFDDEMQFAYLELDGLI